MQGYDLDGTLAATDFTAAVRKPMPGVFADAPVLHTPITDFVVITGRPHATAAERAATLGWLQSRQPHFKDIHYVDATGVQAIAEAKAEIITRLGLTDYTDNNRDVIQCIATLGVGVKLWVMGADGVRVVAGVVDSLWRTEGCRVVRADGTSVRECASEVEAEQLVRRLVRGGYRVGHAV
jgi:hypothetical protein